MRLQFWKKPKASSLALTGSSKAPALEPFPDAALSLEDVKRAIPMLEARVNDLKEYVVDSDDKTSARETKALEVRLNETAARIFPQLSAQFARLYSTEFSEINSNKEETTYNRYYLRDAALKNARVKFKNELLLLNERLQHGIETTSVRAMRSYESLPLQREIERAASGRFRSGQYADAVEAAVKALNGLVRLRSQLEFDGSKLMQNAFGGDKPILRFNNLSNQSDKDEQTGFMMLFSGAVSGLRNPRAHGFIHDEPERALEFIAFVSLLAKLLDEAIADLDNSTKEGS